MSRCYPYPPPGYQKKAQLPDVSVPAKVVAKEKKKTKDKEKEKKVKDIEKDREKKSKDTSLKEKKENTGDKDKDKDKEKHKERRDKEKKEKKRKDGDSNGISHDKDPRSSKLQRTSQVINVPHSNEENGRVREIMLSGAVACPLERDGRDAAKPSGSVVGSASHPSMYIKKEQPNGKVDLALQPLVLSKPLGGSPLQVEAAPCSRPSNHNHLIDSNNFGSQRPQKLPDFSICDTLLQHASWSTLDDEDWLCPSSERLHTKPKAKVEEDTSHQVWAEAVYLSSVDMYALPYVVPY